MADQLAGLRAITSADAPRRMLPNALHTLIMAILARLFARLEQVFLLWQAGQLPPPPASRKQAHAATPQGETAARL